MHYLVDEEHALCYFAGFRERPRLMTLTAIDAEVTKEQPFHLYFSTRQIELPENLLDCWKRLPVICIPAPTKMVYRAGPALLYYVTWANQLVVNRQIVPQEPELIALASRRTSWLRTHFTSARGKRTFDNPTEWDRVKVGW